MDPRLQALVAVLLLSGCGGSGLNTFPPPKDADHTGSPEADADTDADVDTDVDADADADADSAHTAIPAAWSHAIAVDGDLGDWLPAETFPTSAGGTGYVGWDETNVYVAVAHPDVATGGPLHWVTVYVGGGPGSATTSGVAHGTQAPTLPTGFTDLVRWKVDGSFDSRLTWDGATWVETPGWLGARVAEGNGAVELALPRADFGLVDTALVHVALVYEGAGYESTYAPIPAGSFLDGYDPDYGLWYAFDLAGGRPPTATPASTPVR